MIKIATVCTGIGSPEQALKNLGIKHEIVFGCEIDKYARQTYLANFTPNQMFEDMTKQSWERTDIFPREDRLFSDLFIGGIPCQAFSLAGKRLGELDPCGLLFFDFYRYVKNQKPKAFIIENVKGLLSDNKGKTFQNWLQLLGRSVNNQNMMFQHPDSLGYNLYWTVLNTKDFGLPQNRERVFLVGIRSDLPNTFRFPVGWTLEKLLKDVLESEVDEKYYLSNKSINSFLNHKERHQKKGTGFQFKPKNHNEIANCYVLFEPIAASIRGRYLDGTRSGKNKGGKTTQCLEINTNKDITNTLTTTEKDNVVIEPKIIGYTRDEKGRVIRRHEKDIAGTITSASGGGGNTDQFVKIPQNDISLNQVYSLYEDNSDAGRVYSADGLACTIKAQGGGGGAKTGLYALEDTEKGYIVFNGLLYRIRRLTPLECFRLQGFPDEFVKPVSDTQLYKQAGNTISVPVIQGIIENLITVLKK